MRAYQGIAFRFAMAITRDASAAEEVIQESFVKAYFALNGFDTSSAFRPWLLSIVTNEALNRQRSDRRRIARHERAAAQGSMASPQSFEPGPETGVIEAERREFVLRALDRLSESDRLILTYRYLLDLPVTELADLLAIRHRTARSRISRALSRLRDTLLEQAEVDIDDPNSGGSR